MDTAQIMVTLTGLALIAGTLWFFFGKGAGSAPSAGKARYACPMHPWITSSDPSADCSICGMKLTRGGDQPH
jgi:hypothetical protein